MSTEQSKGKLGWRGGRKGSTAKDQKDGKDRVSLLFGVPLEEVMQRQIESGVTCEIPVIIKECVDWLNEHEAFKTEGIFRVSGKQAVVDYFKEQYDTELKIDWLDPQLEVHVVAGLLKLYLRELPEPLFIFRYYQTFLKVSANPDVGKRLQFVRKLLYGMPPANRAIVLFLLEFLAQVSSHEDQNKMGSSNLATIFAPNVLRSDMEDPMQMMTDSVKVHNIVKLMIDEVDFMSNRSNEPRSLEHVDSTTEAAAPKERQTVSLSELQHRKSSRSAEHINSDFTTSNPSSPLCTADDAPPSPPKQLYSKSLESPAPSASLHAKEGAVKEGSHQHKEKEMSRKSSGRNIAASSPTHLHHDLAEKESSVSPRSRLALAGGASLKPSERKSLRDHGEIVFATGKEKHKEKEKEKKEKDQDKDNHGTKESKESKEASNANNNNSNNNSDNNSHSGGSSPTITPNNKSSNNGGVSTNNNEGLVSNSRTSPSGERRVESSDDEIEEEEIVEIGVGGTFFEDVDDDTSNEGSRKKSGSTKGGSSKVAKSHGGSGKSDGAGSTRSEEVRSDGVGSGTE